MNTVEKIELDGCKILKNIRWFHLTGQGNTKKLLSMFQQISKRKINLIFVNCLLGSNIHLNIGIDLECDFGLDEGFKKAGFSDFSKKEAILLSVFPHKNSPTITGKILGIYSSSDPKEVVFINSFSAISIVCCKSTSKQIIKSLVKDFKFKRPIEDWCRVQREQRHLYREVVASYQEKKPKVYFLEYRTNQHLIELHFCSDNTVSYLTKVLVNSNGNQVISFLSSSPKKRGSVLMVSVSNSEFDFSILHQQGISLHTDMSVFCMNGPHFGDRYGIAELIFKAVDEADVQVAGISCSTNSIVGVLKSRDIEKLISYLKDYFEIPSIIKKAC